MMPSLLVDNTGSAQLRTPRLDLILRARSGLPASNGRLGVLGGGYNPITRAHLILAGAAVEQFDLHEIIFVLSQVLPHKHIIGASIEQRLEMMRISVTDIPYISVGLCTHGLFLDICIALAEVYPQNPDIFFITGRDAAQRILTWPYPDPVVATEQMFQAFQLLVFPRQGKLTLPENPIIHKYTDRIHTLRLKENLDHISSTKVRHRLSAGQPINELVLAEVASYIIQHNIYKDQFKGH